MEKRKIKQVAIGLVAAMALITATVPSATALVSADELKQEAVTPNTTTIPNPTGREVLLADVPLSEMILIDGVAYDSQGNIVVEHYGDSLKRGKMSLAIKAIKAAWSKLPLSVKNTIGVFGGIDVFLSTLDHWTGAVEDGIFWACKQVGMPDVAAWFVSKALTAVAL
ncbi:MULTISPECIES: hypothetical protein [Lactococcus]|uniref:hypothetical protein n=1 Tax=Lactococcus TaxID=1357 RepID=UPI0038522BDE